MEMSNENFEFYTHMNNVFHMLPKHVNPSNLSPVEFYKYICDIDIFKGLKVFLENHHIGPTDDDFENCFSCIQQKWIQSLIKAINSRLSLPSFRKNSF